MLCLFLISLICLCMVITNDIFGCGGYVKSDVEINFAEVGIKLYTVHGNLKYETDCAPNNGYYFIPLYDRGDYVLKVSPPPGWSFDPQEVEVKFNGNNDVCTRGEDINFHFKGFAVLGMVVSAGTNSGPSGVRVDLLKDGKEINSTMTDEGGHYIFSPLGAGTYTVRASHKTWHLLQNEVVVVVADKNGDAGMSLVIDGYNLEGFAVAEGRPIPGVQFVLHGDKSIHSQNYECTSGSPRGYKVPTDRPLLCHVATSADGQFVFRKLTPGNYSLVAFFESETSAYDFTPLILDISLGHGDLRIEEPFEVTGFSFSGRVIAYNRGVRDAKVTFDGKDVVQTDKEGNFVLFHVRPGRHTVEVVADGLTFEKISADIRTSEPSLAPILPTHYKVCFQVSVGEKSDNEQQWSIEVKDGEGNAVLRVITGQYGLGCCLLKEGSYGASVVVNEQPNVGNIRFGPHEHLFTVGKELLPVLTFSQFLGTIYGEVICLEPCPSLAISMRPSSSWSGVPRRTGTVQGKFVFKDVLPGNYELTVDKEEWCWKHMSQLIMVDTENKSVVVEHTGYRLSVDSTHSSVLSYTTNRNVSGVLEVPVGISRQCVSSPGKYRFTSSGCHKFGPTDHIWDTSSPHLLSLVSTHHLLRGYIEAEESGPFSISIQSNDTKVTVDAVLYPEKPNRYIFEQWIHEGSHITITPSSSTNLFQYVPPSHSLVMPRDCLIDTVVIRAERALFIKGFVNPPLAGVNVKIEWDGNLHSFTTNADGLYLAGPLDKSHPYTITAEMPGYMIKPPSQQINADPKNLNNFVKLDFEAYKLAEIIVKVVDELGSSLSGVLVSTSGGKDYRQNSLTDPEGIVTFQSLMPSDYFLRPMLKEYRFDPVSKMVSIEEGATVNLTVRGKRVAYSVIGQTVSLTGEVESSVVVEAVGKNESCSDYQEEGTSDAQGNFRVRGLVPECKYILRLKQAEGINKHVDHALPWEREIQTGTSDLHVRLVVIRPFLQMDVAGFVKTREEFLSTLTAEVFREDTPDTPIHSVPINSHPFFMLPPMMADGKSYTVNLVSSLSKLQYTYKTPSKSFVADEGFKHLEFRFNAKMKSLEAEMSNGTVFGLLFFAVMVLAGVNFDKIQPIAVQMLSRYSKARVKGVGKMSGSQSSDTPHIEPIARKRVIRKT